MNHQELSDLWRGFVWNPWKRWWVCKHCSSIIFDPITHAKWHRDLVDAIKMVVDAS